MNVKTRYHPLAIVIFSVFAHIPAGAVDNITLNFSGSIKMVTCEIIAGDGQDVALGDVSKTYFGNPGDVSPAKNFTITLSCPSGAMKQATVTFNGPTDSTDKTLLALDSGDGGANGVAVRLNENDGITQVKLNEPTEIKALSAGVNSLQFTAQYVALVDRPQIKAGAANATAQFTINYQ